MYLKYNQALLWGHKKTNSFAAQKQHETLHFWFNSLFPLGSFF